MGSSQTDFGSDEEDVEEIQLPPPQSNTDAEPQTDADGEGNQPDASLSEPLTLQLSVAAAQMDAPPSAESDTAVITRITQLEAVPVGELVHEAEEVTDDSQQPSLAELERETASLLSPSTAATRVADSGDSV